MSELFDAIEATKEEYDTYIELSMVEIYNEHIRDLLSDDFPTCPRGGLKLLEKREGASHCRRGTHRTPKFCRGGDGPGPQRQSEAFNFLHRK